LKIIRKETNRKIILEAFRAEIIMGGIAKELEAALTK